MSEKSSSIVSRVPRSSLIADYRASLRSSVRSLDQLSDYLVGRGVDPTPFLEQARGIALLPIRIPTYYLDLVDWSDPADPLMRQVLPTQDELMIHPDEVIDPIGDDAYSPVPGIVHRYPDRVLLLLTVACAVHCRFCFRREFIGQPMRALRREQEEAAFAYIDNHPEIWEVILSGGDILTFPDTYIARVIKRLRSIEHVQIVRLHSRVPAVLPARLTRNLAGLLRQHGPTYLVVHVNHGREVTPAFVEAVGRLVDVGVPVLAQTVLMRGVNDTPEALADLFRKLVSARVKPYYLHHPDLARGTGHFRVSIEHGQSLMRALHGHISGLCMPTYVLDTPGGFGKIPLTGQYIQRVSSDHYDVRNHLNEHVDYHDPAGGEA